MSTEVTYRPDPADGLPAMKVNVWARRKHHYLDRYLDIFAGGMKNKWSRRVYIDLFAGPGMSTRPQPVSRWNSRRPEFTTERPAALVRPRS